MTNVIVRVASDWLARELTTGNRRKASRVVSGLPDGAVLVDAEVAGSDLLLYFEPPSTDREIDIVFEMEGR